MPQMMLLNWLISFLFLSIMLGLFSVLNFYVSFNKSVYLSPTTAMTTTLNSKW